MVERKKMSEEKLDAAVASWTTYAKFGNSWRLRRKMEEKLGFIAQFSPIML